MRLFDCHACGNRWARRHPVEKMLIAGGSLFTSMMLPALPAACLLVGMIMLTLLGARVSWRTWLACMAVPASFVLISSTALMLRLGVASDGSWVAAFDVSAWPHALAVVVRSMAAIASLVFLLMTTPVTDIMQVLRRAGCPEPIVILMSVSYRIIFLLLEKMSVMVMAQHARLGSINHRARMRSGGYLAANLLAVSIRQSQRLARGWASRGYDGASLPFPPAYDAVSWRRCIASAMVWGILIIAGLRT